MYFLGAISGTSMDGVDAVVARFDGARFEGLVAHIHRDYPPELRQKLLRVAREQPALTAGEWCRLDAAVAEVFADAALDLLRSAAIDATQVAALGSHGQTVFHDAAKELRITWQLGDPSRIAACTGLTVVADFRRGDLALGGQGAPLVPAFHHALFASPSEPRCVLNLGGIANLSLLPSARAEDVRGFDTGPGNGLLDEWIAVQRQQAFDTDGAFAAGGKADESLLAALLAEPYFSQAPPKSCGRGDFHLGWARARFPALNTLAPENVQASFAELTARSVAQAITASGLRPRRLLVCGGGVRNGDLMRRLASHLAGVKIEATDAHGLDAQWIEASAFAWLAMRTLASLPGNLPAVTGARAPAILGGIYRA